MFGPGELGGYFRVWVPGDKKCGCDLKTGTTGPEYRVYYVTRRGTARAIAESFPEFVTDISLKNRLHEFFGWQNENPEDWPPQTFLPYRAG